MHIEIEKDKAYTFTRSYYVNGVLQLPTSGTATVKDNNDGDAQASVALSITTLGEMSFIFTAANNDTDDKNFQVEWSFVVGGETIKEYQLFDVVLKPITNNVRDEDLFKYMPDLRNDVKELYGETSSAGSTTTMISDRLKADQRNWSGGFVEIYVAATTVHEARVTAYNSTTSTVTFTPAYSIAIATDLNYRIRTSYQDFIDTAFDLHVKRDLRNKNKIASGYIDGDVVKTLIIYKALELISFGKREATEDTWDLRYIESKNEYNTQLQKFFEPYDTNEDGSISDKENAERPNMSSMDIYR